MPNYTWYGAPIYRYRNDVTGRYIGDSTIRKWSDTSLSSSANSTTELANRIANDSITVGAWEASMRKRITEEYLKQYMLAVGGKDNMSQVDYGSVGGMIADQFRYLGDFAQEIADGNLSEAEIARRSKMYLLSAREAYERGSARVRGLPTMPAYGGDGRSCLGLTNCGCFWEYHFRNGVWECYWIMDHGKDNCELCEQHAVEWSPLIINVQGEIVE